MLDEEPRQRFPRGRRVAVLEGEVAGVEERVVGELGDERRAPREARARRGATPGLHVGVRGGVQAGALGERRVGRGGARGAAGRDGRRLGGRARRRDGARAAREQAHRDEGGARRSPHPARVYHRPAGPAKACSRAAAGAPCRR